MSEARTSDDKYHVEIRDARGVVIGDKNVVYQYFLDERYRPLAEHLIAFDDLIAERTTDFVGRAFLDARLATFMEQHDRGYFVLVGEPGIGKTAWAAHVVREYQALHHFNVSAMGIVRPDQCLENLCAQIIARFQLDQPFLPVNAGRDGSLLDKLLRQAAERLDGSKLMIMVDALDEAQMPADIRGANALYLPPSLPAGVYFVLTRRPQPMPLDTAPGTPSETFALDAELPNNQADVRAYLRKQAARPEFVARLAEQHISTERFVEELAERSAGNFMYLAYLLPDIAAGLFAPPHLTSLPQGLRGYYDRFWNELETAKGEGREAWTKFYKPVIGMLVAAREPVSAAWIGRILNLSPDEIADFALARWRKFLCRTEASNETRWRLYHVSFADFLAEKVDGAKRYHDQIADYYREFCDGNWLRLMEVDGTYGLRHMGAHLAAAERWEHLRALVVEGDGDHQPWADARYLADGVYTGYLSDLGLVRNRAENSESQNASDGIRCAAIQASINSLVGSISPDLLQHLVTNGLWSTRRALAHISQMPEDWRRIQTLAKLGPMLTESTSASALNVARSITDENERGRAVVTVAKHLPDRLKLNAVDLLCSLESEWARAQSLAAITEHLPDMMKLRVMDAICMISVERARAEAWGQMIRYLPVELKERVLIEILGLEDNGDRADALSRIVEFLEESAKPSAANIALTAVQKLEDVKRRAEIHVALAAYMSDDSKRELLTEIRSLRDEITCARLAAQLAAYLPDNAKEDALTAISECDDSFGRANALIRIAPHLPQRLLDRLFVAAAETVDEGYRSIALRGVAPFFPDRLRNAALSAVAAMREDNVRASALSGITEYLPKTSKALAVDMALELRDERLQVQALNGMVEHLPASQLARATNAVRAMQDPIARAEGLTTLVARVPEEQKIDMLTNALDAARSIPEADWRALRLTNLIPLLPVSQARTQLADEALRASRTIADHEACAQNLVALVPRLPKDKGVAVLELALGWARRVSEHGRRASILFSIAQQLPDILSASDWAYACSYIWVDERLGSEWRGDGGQGESGALSPAGWLASRPKEFYSSINLESTTIPHPMIRTFAQIGLATVMGDEGRPPVLAQALNSARSIDAPENLALALGVIASLWPGGQPADIVYKALDALEKIGTAKAYVETVAWLAQLLPYTLRSSLTERVMRVVWGVNDETQCIRLLTSVLPYLPDTVGAEAVKKAVAIGRAIPDAAKRAEALAEIAAVAPSDPEARIVADALNATGLVTDRGRQAGIWASLAPIIPAQIKAELLPKALEAAKNATWPPPHARADLYTKIMESWEKEGFAGLMNAWQVWHDLLRYSASFRRSEFLTDLTALTPLMIHVNGPQAVLDTVDAVLNVQKWWP